LQTNGAKGAVVASMLENLPEAHAADLVRRGIVPIHGIAEAFDAAEAAAFIGEAWTRRSRSPLKGGRQGAVGGHSSSVGALEPPPLTPPHKGEGGASVSEFPSPLWGGVRGGGVEPTAVPDRNFANPCQPDEAAAKALLADAGLPVPQGRRAASVEEAATAAESLGFPIALKALGVAHKSEAGAVKLNLKSADEVRAAAAALLPLGSGLYVERMVAGGVAELIVGFTRDPVFGPTMTLGSGGVLVELLQDSATLLLPASRDEIEAALRGLKLFPLLDGYRGRPKADVEAAIDAVSAIGAFVAANADAIEELDINPLIACKRGEGAWIADALLVRRKTS
jgi:hypothetical protein